VAAKRAARGAGRFLVRARVSGVTVTAEPPRDVKLEVDRQSEERIIQALRQDSGFAILTEEGGLVEGDGSRPDLRWIVDPLDGSLNYRQGIPFCCVSVGLWERDEPLLGVVYDFSHGELFSGIVGIGAWLNQALVRVSEARETQRAVLCTGFPVSTDFSSCALSGFVEQVRAYRKVRLLGSAALSLAYVAAGRADAYYERDIKIWDVAAGLAIVRAAGGAIVRMPSAVHGALTVYAGNPSPEAIGPSVSS
jgi:myo-inositol-1(or 4)-monophosphatase